jgi:hypothetical protein
VERRRVVADAYAGDALITRTHCRPLEGQRRTATGVVLLEAQRTEADPRRFGGAVGRLVAGAGRAEDVFIFARPRYCGALVPVGVRSVELEDVRCELSVRLGAALLIVLIVFFVVVVVVVEVVVGRGTDIVRVGNVDLATCSRQLVQNLAESLAFSLLGRRTVVVVDDERMVVVDFVVRRNSCGRLDGGLSHSH